MYHDVTVDNLFILNDHDRPCVYMLVLSNPLRYACVSIRDKFPNLVGDRLTSLREFGFERNGDVFQQVNPSIARYSDGRPREWQGSIKFTIEELFTTEKI